MINPQYIEHINTILDVFVFIGICASAISGSLRAIDSKMDITGAILLAFVVANAGGTFRDIFLNVPIFWMANHLYIWLSIGIGSITFMLCYYKPKLLGHRKLQQMLIFTDAIGLGIFCVVGVEKATLLGQNSSIAIIMGIWTAVGGGVIADIIANRIPLVFSSELYITVCLAGAISYMGLSQLLPQVIAAFSAVIFMVLLRILSVKYHWRLPIVQKNQ